MEKRVVLFLVLSLAIILGYDYLLKRLGYAPAPEQVESQGQSADAGPTAPERKTGPAGEPHQPVSGEPKPAPAGREIAKGPDVSVAAEDMIEVETDLYKAVFSNRGARLVSWALKQYTTKVTGGEPVQLVHDGDPFKGPLALRTADAAVTRDLAEGLYRVERDGGRLDATHPSGRVTFSYRSPDGRVRVEKHFTFHHDSYLVDVAVKAEGLGSDPVVGLGTNFGIIEWGEGFIGLIGPAWLVDDKIEKETPDAELERKGTVRWVAIQDKYFLSVLIPTNATAVVVRKEGEKLVSAGARFASGTDLAFQLYAGPKEYDTLRAMHLRLEDTIDFGWFIFGSWDIVRAVAKPIFYVLRFLYEFTHNYGVTIVLLTLGIKMLFVPLQYKSYKSMKQMQLVQPKVVELQAKYKDDREKLNAELIKLYRDHKVNPVGGCLPMVLQMPVFVALFNILYMTIDLRQAPFVLWITDLSVQDPYYVLPVLMGASMVLQQKIMPTTMDPTQAKVMLLLPAFMTILFLNFPSGLVLYWLTNNVLTITQQVVTERYFLKHPLVAPAGAETGADGEKRAGKKKKAKSDQKAEADSQVEA